MDWEKYNGVEWEDESGIQMLKYSCMSCGGEIIGDSTMASTKCPYCDNPVVVPGQLSGDLKPDLIIPFKHDKNAAKEMLKQHYQKKKLLPRVFKTENNIENVKGIYVPFWLFNCDSEGKLRLLGKKDRSWTSGSYRYTESSFYQIDREGKLGFDYVPVDGSSKIEDKMMESVEPYNLNDMKGFEMAYLAGYMTDKYDVDADVCINRANDRVKKSVEKTLLNTVKGYSIVNIQNLSVKLQNNSVKYGLLPVWMLNTKWGETKYTFAMNGQTGKLIGDLPIDKGLFIKYLILYTSVLFGISSLILWFLYFR